MALFGNSKKTTKAKPVKASAGPVKDREGNLSTILLTPWLSEKALISTEAGIYTFHVAQTATKKDIALAVEKFYKVTPRQIRVVNLPAKKVAMRRRRGFGTRSAKRKAYVFLKKGDTIQFA